MKKIPVWMVLLLWMANAASAQKEFTFNRPGNVCYFPYVVYTADGNYAYPNRPYIFVIGASGSSAMEAFNSDTLRQMAQFGGYMFVYVPNNGGSPKEKLYCLDALEMTVLYNVPQNKKNAFLQVNDDAISLDDLKGMGLQRLYKTIRIREKAVVSAPVVAAPTAKKDTAAPEPLTPGLASDFKADLIVPAAGKPKPPPYTGPPKAFNFTITGKLVDINSYEALPFATVNLKGKTVATTTNADGQFTLLHVPTDTTTLQVSYLGYKRSDFKLSPLMNKSDVIIEMEPLSSQLQEITVAAEKEDLMNASDDLGIIKMSPSKLNQLPNVGEKDIMRSFQLMPGVSASNESSSGLYVRGGTPDQNLVVYDGFTVYQVDHLYGFYSAFNSNAIKDVQLYKGGFESKFGGRLSSVTEITGKDGNQNKFNIGGDISLLSFNAFVEVPIGKKITFVAAGRRSFQGPLYQKIFKQYNTGQTQGGFGGRSNAASTVKSYFYDLNSKFTYRPTDKDILSLSVYNGTDKLDNGRNFSPGGGFGGSSGGSFSSKIVDLTRYGNTGGSVKWSRKWNTRIYGTTLVSYSNYFSKRERSNESEFTNSSGEVTSRKFGTFENNNLQDYSAKTDYTFDLSNNNQLGAGAWSTYYDIAYTYSQNDTSTILNRHNFGVLSGAYLQDKIKLLKGKIMLEPGIRASYYNVTSKMYYEPRFYASYNITSKLSLKASTGQFYQFANQVTREDILNGNKTFWILSDGTNVPVSQAMHYMGGISYDTHNFLFSVEGWYKDLSGLTEHSLRFNNAPTVQTSYTENFYKGIGYSQGMEFLVQKKFGNFSGWVSYTLSKTRSKFEVYSPTYYAANQDVPNEFKIVGIYKWKKFVFSATWIYATGRPYTAPSGAYSLTLLDGNTQDFFTVTSKNSLRLPDYHRLDVAATYMFRNEKGREFGSLGFSIFNLYNRRNVWYKEFQIVDKQIIETNIQYLGITPNLTLSLKLR